MSSRLIEKMRAIEDRHARRRGDGVGRKPQGVLSTGWAEVDAALGGGLARGGLHEWLGLVSALRSAGRTAPTSIVAPIADETRNVSRRPDEHARGGREPWRPPVGVLIHLAWRVLDTDAEGRWAVWIGRRCFPYPAVALRRGGGDRRLLERSLFVSPRTPAERLWAIDLALRSPAVGVVIADGSELDLPATRRVQLVAKNHGVPVFLVRPPWERAEPSAAHTRWLVRRSGAGGAATGPANPTWVIELLRCKGVHLRMATDAWRLEWDRAACTLHLFTAMADSTGDSQPASTGRGCGRSSEEGLNRRRA